MAQRSDGSGTGRPQKLPSGVHAMRRGGVRREVSERVTLRNDDGRMLEGWALNISRGGLRAILEEKVLLGQKFEIRLGSEGGPDDVTVKSGRIAWLQEEPDGVIVGIEFVETSGVTRASEPDR